LLASYYWHDLGLWLNEGCDLLFTWRHVSLGALVVEDGLKMILQMGENHSFSPT